MTLKLQLTRLQERDLYKKKKAPRKRAANKPKKQTLPFDMTRLGYMLKTKANLEYNLIMSITKSGYMPLADVIETLSYSSINPVFRSVAFRKALIAYRTQKNFGGRRANSDQETLQRDMVKGQKVLETKIKKSGF